MLVHPKRRIGVGLRKACVNVKACDWMVQIQKVNWRGGEVRGQHGRQMSRQPESKGQ